MLSILKITLGIVFLTAGCGVYLIFRSPTLNIYQWCMVLGISNTIDSLRYSVQDWDITEWIKYSLPDGLYVAAYILIMDAIWQESDSLIKHFIIAFVPVVTITSEIFQYFGLVKGTFDFCDMVCYSVPPIAYYFYKYYSFKFNNFKIQQL